MSLLGGGNKSSLPSLSWDSVLSPSSGADTTDVGEASGPEDDAEQEEQGSNEPSGPIGHGISGVLGSLGLETSTETQQPISLGLSSSAAETETASAPEPVATPPAEPVPAESPSQAQPVEQQPVQQSPVEQLPVEQQPVQQSPVEQLPVQPPVEQQQPVEQSPVEQQSAQPPVEQQPVEQQPDQQSPVEQSPGQQPVPPAAPVQAAPVPQVAPPVAPAIAAVPAVAPAPRPTAPAALGGYQQMLAEPPKRRRRQRSGGSGLGLLLTVLVLAALVAAGFVYGKPYLFPDDFDAQSKPYADAIETVRGTPITDPFLILDEAPAVYASGYDAQYLGDEWHDQVPMWRAFGLADASFDPSTVASVVPQRPTAYFAFADGQIHTESPIVEGVPDAAVARAAALAVLDQDYQWSLAIDGRADERAAVQHSLVIAEADRIRTAGGFPGPVADDTTPAELAALPPLVAHRIVAPELYARVVAQPTPSDEARMRDLESFGAVLPALTPLGAGTTPVLAEGETVSGAGLALDRNFWFLAFDAHLPAATAADLSRDLNGASVTPFTNLDGKTCWAATLVAPSGDAAFFLAAGMNEWVAAAPAATAASTSVVSELVVELRVCDPSATVAPVAAPAPGAATAADGAPVDDGATVEGQEPVTDPAAEVAVAPVAPGSADSVRALQAYRATQLAVVSGITNAGGDSLAISQALAELDASSIGDDLALAAVAMTDSQLAAAAVERTAGIVQAVAATVSVPAAPAPAADGQVPVGSEAPVPDDG